MEYFKYLESVVQMVTSGDYCKATKFISPTYVIRAVRKRHNKKVDKRGNIQITLTLGKPNFLEREFIKLCKKAKEPFPIKNIQLKESNPKKK